MGHSGVKLQPAAGALGFIDEAGYVIIRTGCSHLMDALHAELLACLARVRAAGEMGTSNVIIETDSMLAHLRLHRQRLPLHQ